MSKRPDAERRATSRAAREPAQDPVFGAVRLTHAQREVFGDTYRKLDVARYYAAVMDRLLPQIERRPLSIVRCPDGIAGGCFFQKHVMRGLKRVPSARIEEQSGRRASYLFADSADAVFELVQFNALEFHPWAATVDDTEHTDYV